jgi:hypothetical protein
MFTLWRNNVNASCGHEDVAAAFFCFVSHNETSSSNTEAWGETGLVKLLNRHIQEGALINLWLYKGNNKLQDWKNVFTLHIPLDLHIHLWLRCSNFFNPWKIHSYGCAANTKIGNKKSQKFISTPTSLCFADSVFVSPGKKTFCCQVFHSVCFPVTVTRVTGKERRCILTCQLRDRSPACPKLRSEFKSRTRTAWHILQSGRRTHSQAQ